MSGDTALFFSLLDGDPDATSRLAREALTRLVAPSREARWILELLAGSPPGMPGSGPGMRVVGAVAKSPDEDAIAQELSPFLRAVFLAFPAGRALLWAERYEADDHGAVAVEIAAEPSTSAGATAGLLALGRYLVDASLSPFVELGGAAAPPAWARAVTSLCVMCECDDEGGLAAPARTAAAELRRSDGGTPPSRSLALAYLDDLAARPRSTAYAGPKGGLSVWGRAGLSLDLDEWVGLLTPFFRGVSGDAGGFVLLYRGAGREAGACRAGPFASSEGDSAGFGARHYDFVPARPRRKRG